MNGKSQFMAVLMAWLVFSSAFVGAIGVASADSGGNAVLGPAMQNDLGTFDLNVSPNVVSYGQQPSFLVTVNSGSTVELETWANNSEDRQIKEWVSQDTALVVAPSKDVANPAILSDSGLYTKDFVLLIDYNVEVSTPKPYDSSSSVVKPNFLVNALTAGALDGKAKDVDETTIQKVRQNIDVNDVSQTGSGQTVAVIDTGLDYDQSLYQDRVVAGKNFLTGETIDKSANDYSAVSDGNGHGSWVASSIAANPDINTSGETYEGIAPDSNLVIAKALSASGGGQLSDIIDSLKWACGREDVDVINMSLGTPMYSQQMNDAVQSCVEDHGKTVVVASGNRGHKMSYKYIATPADAQTDVVSVGATTNETPSEAETAVFSSPGPDRGLASNGKTSGEAPDVGAPGMSIEVKTANGTPALSGTSMATPIVSGVMILGEEKKDMTPAQALERIKKTSEPVPGSGVQEIGHGMVNAENFITYTEPEKTQEEVRSQDAQKRDLWYKSYSGSWFINQFYGSDGEPPSFSSLVG